MGQTYYTQITNEVHCIYFIGKKLIRDQMIVLADRFHPSDFPTFQADLDPVGMIR